MVSRSGPRWKLVLVAVRYFQREVEVVVEKWCRILFFNGNVASLFRERRRSVTSGVKEILGM